MPNRIGKREREARKRHRRAWIFANESGRKPGAAWAKFKLGRKKMARHYSALFAVRRTNAASRSLTAIPVIEAEPREQASTGAPTVGPEQVQFLPADHPLTKG